ncbi:MAG: type I secretion system permease/ATPase [Azoarcus sp.]|jgi:ATP-binding cassette subfamily C exporter for protease/lipase|nr:type I secretion system permease/ATPase [Azoarcus sp.]
MKAMKPTAKRGELSRFLMSFRREFAYALGFTALVNLLMLTPTLYMLQIFDRVMVSYSEFTLYAVTLMLLLFLGAMSFAEWVRARLLVRLGVRLDMTLNARVFETAFGLHNLEMGGVDGARLFEHLTRIRQFLTGAGLFALFDAPWTPIYILVLFLLHPWLGGLAIVFCLILCGLAWLSSQVMAAPLEDAAQAARKEAVVLENKLRHAAAVESMGMLGNMRGAWMRRRRLTLAFGKRGQDAQVRMQALTRFVRFMQQSLSLGAGAVLVIQGEISPGAMIAANALMSRATHPVDALMGAWKEIIAAKKAFLELETALDAFAPRGAIQATAQSEAAAHHHAQGMALRLARVGASAPALAVPILQDISLDLPAGVALGVTGPSGSGKSTLARVILDIWPSWSGDVLLDGRPIQAWERRELGYLPQDVELFEGSIAENVARYSQFEAPQVIAACRQAGVHEMILRFPKGYETQVGEGGRALSGGQRQRIGLARALYGNPRLVVLDEPNANLDDAGDRALLAALAALKARGATVVLVSHRPQVMALMDRILVLEAGRIARLTGALHTTRPDNAPARALAPFPAPVPT